MLDFLNEFKTTEEVKAYFERKIDENEYFKRKMEEYHRKKQKQEIMEARRAHISADQQQKKFKHRKNVMGIKRKQTGKDLQTQLVKRGSKMALMKEEDQGVEQDPSEIESVSEAFNDWDEVIGSLSVPVTASEEAQEQSLDYQLNLLKAPSIFSSFSTHSFFCFIVSINVINLSSKSTLHFNVLSGLNLINIHLPL